MNSSNFVPHEQVCPADDNGVFCPKENNDPAVGDQHQSKTFLQKAKWGLTGGGKLSSAWDPSEFGLVLLLAKSKTKQVVSPQLSPKDHNLSESAPVSPRQEPEVTENLSPTDIVFSNAIELLSEVSATEDGTRKKAGSSSGSTGGTAHIQSTRESVQSSLSSFLCDSFNSINEQQKLEEEHANSEISAMLVAANTVLSQVLDSLQAAIEKNPFHESFCLAQMVHQEFVDCIVTSLILSFCEKQLHEMKPGDIGNTMSWLNYCAERWREALPVLSMMAKEDSVQSNIESLLEEYLIRGVQEPVKDMLANIVSSTSEEDVIEEKNGQLVTYQPLDIEFMLEGQLSVAKDILPPRFVCHVLAACNEQMRAMIGNVMLDIESNWKSMGIARLCSVVNDAAQLSEQCEDRNNELLADNGSDEQREAGKDLCKEFIELSLHAAKYLCERILLDLREPEPILTKVGDCIWEEEEGSTMISSTIATLIDYFDDLEEWIPQYYFAKCLKHCFDLTLQIYIDSFFSNTMAKGIENPKRASRALHYDASTLLTFFGTTLAEYHGKAGFYSKEVIEDRLEILSCLSKLLVMASPPTQLQEEIKTLLIQLGIESGVPAVLHLAGLRKANVDVTESTEWHVTISCVTQTLKDIDTSTGHYKVPDLRNSEFLQKVKPIVKDTDDSTMEATNRLVQRPGLSKTWSWRGSFRSPHGTNNNRSNMMSQQSRRKLLVQQSERNLKMPNNWARPGGLSKLRSTRFNMRTTNPTQAPEDHIDVSDITDEDSLQEKESIVDQESASSAEEEELSENLEI